MFQAAVHVGHKWYEIYVGSKFSNQYDFIFTFVIRIKNKEEQNHTGVKYL